MGRVFAWIVLLLICTSSIQPSGSYWDYFKTNLADLFQYNTEETILRSEDELFKSFEELLEKYLKEQKKGYELKQELSLLVKELNYALLAAEFKRETLFKECMNYLKKRLGACGRSYGLFDEDFDEDSCDEERDEEEDCNILSEFMRDELYRKKVFYPELRLINSFFVELFSIAPHHQAWQALKFFKRLKKDFNDLFKDFFVVYP